MILNFYSFGQRIEIVNKSVFSIDSIQFNISKTKYLKKIEEPFIGGGDSQFARKSQIFFKIRNSSSYLSVSIGDSLYIEDLVLLQKDITEYYLFSDTVIESEGRRIYTYSLPTKPDVGEQNLIQSPLHLKNKKYFVLIRVDSEDIKYAFDLINDLQSMSIKLQ